MRLRIFWLTCAAVLVLTSGAAQPPKQKSTSMKPLIDPLVAKLADGVERPNSILNLNETFLPILYPSSHAPNLLELKNGDLLCVWFSGSWEGSSGVGIVMSRRTQGSRNW